jgi:hypothetical protein
MDIFNEDSKNAISQAYDNLKRDEFLNRLFTFIDDTIDVVKVEEQLTRTKENLTRQIFDGVKTKPGPRAKSEVTA